MRKVTKGFFNPRFCTGFAGYSLYVCILSDYCLTKDTITKLRLTHIHPQAGLQKKTFLILTLNIFQNTK